MKTFRIVSLNISEKKGTPKQPVERIELIADFGIRGDAHAGSPGRQVSLLAIEEINDFKSNGASVYPGIFAENITTSGIDPATLPLGTELRIGDTVLEITQIGKQCHHGCAIRQNTGDCIMPKKGVFARVKKGGVITDASIGSYDI